MDGAFQKVGSNPHSVMLRLSIYDLVEKRVNQDYLILGQTQDDYN